MGNVCVCVCVCVRVCMCACVSYTLVVVSTHHPQTSTKHQTKQQTKQQQKVQIQIQTKSPHSLSPTLSTLSHPLPLSPTLSHPLHSLPLSPPPSPPLSPTLPHPPPLSTPQHYGCFQLDTPNPGFPPTDPDALHPDPDAPLLLHSSPLHAVLVLHLSLARLCHAPSQGRPCCSVFPPLLPPHPPHGCHRGLSLRPPPPHPPPSLAHALASSWNIPSSSPSPLPDLSPSRNAITTALSLVARIIPLLYESARDELPDRILWRHSFGSPFEPSPSSSDHNVAEDHNVADHSVADHNVADHNVADSSSDDDDDDLDDSILPTPALPFGVTLIHALLALAFLPGFTLPSSSSSSSSSSSGVEEYERWLISAGPQQPAHPPPNPAQTPEWEETSDPEILEARRAVVEALLALISSPMYSSSSAYYAVDNHVGRILTSPTCAPTGVALFTSILTSLAALGPTLGSATWTGVVGDSPSSRAFRSYAGLLAVALDYIPMEDVGVVHGDGTDAPATPPLGPQTPDLVPHNILRAALDDRLSADPDLASRLATGLATGLAIAGSSPLDGEFTVHLQILFVLWTLSTSSPSFGSALTSAQASKDAPTPPPVALAEAICGLLLASISPIDHHGLLHVTSFLLLLLSSEREFCVALNTPYASPQMSLSLPPFGAGSYADVLFLTLSAVFTARNPDMERVQDTLLIAACNMAPYVASLTTTTASKLTSLLAAHLRASRVSSPPSPTHVSNATHLLVTLGHILAHQHATHSPLLHALIDIYDELVATADALVESEEEELMEALVPLVNLIGKVNEDLEAHLESQGLSDPSAVDAFLATYTLVGILPPVAGISVRRYHRTRRNDLWLSRYLWSIVFVAANDPPMFTGTAVRLFQYRP